MYGFGLAVQQGGIPTGLGLMVGLGSAFLVSLAVGFLALRTKEVAFMIVTLMFAQAVYLASLYFGEWTRGDEGFVIQQADRVLWGIDLSAPDARYLAAWALFSIALLATLWLVRSPAGRVLVAIRENDARAVMLGYNTYLRKLGAVAMSGTLSAASGAAYGLLFGYVGASFAGVQYSILPLLWVLLGGAGTVLGPFVGALFTFYLIDIASGITDAYLLVVGAVLIGLTLFARQGLLGELRARLWRALP
jgi:branched-chain amino acid transport system permease protein